MIFVDYGLELKVGIEVEHNHGKSLVKTISINLGRKDCDSQFLVNGKSIGINHAINEFVTNLNAQRVYSFERFVHDACFIVEKTVEQIDISEDRKLNGQYFNPEFSRFSRMSVATAHKDPSLFAAYQTLLTLMIPPEHKRGITLSATYRTNHNL